MGLATIINMVVFVCVPAWGDRIATFAWALWWIDAIIALAINFFIPFIIMRNHKVCTLLSSQICVINIPRPPCQP